MPISLKNVFRKKPGDKFRNMREKFNAPRYEVITPKGSKVQITHLGIGDKKLSKEYNLRLRKYIEEYYKPENEKNKEQQHELEKKFNEEIKKLRNEEQKRRNSPRTERQADIIYTKLIKAGKKIFQEYKSFESVPTSKLKHLMLIEYREYISKKKITPKYKDEQFISEKQIRDIFNNVRKKLQKK